MKIGIPCEHRDGETRVALVPDSVAKLVRAGLEVVVEPGAGAASIVDDAAYTQAGATLAAGPADVFAADIVVKVRAPGVRPDGFDEIAALHDGSILIALLNPLSDFELVAKLAERRIKAFSLESVPRITRAQSMDVLSAMSTVAGYKAVLLAANALPKMFPLLMTAAGTVTPAKVFIIGAGVAGLQAIATAKRLGAVVSAYDTRPAVKEQVQSLGAKFIQIDLGAEGEGQGGYARALTAEEQEKQRLLMGDTVAASDVVITTALVPGRKAPLLIDEPTVKRMKRGSVIVDMAAETGGNCALTVPGEQVVREGVTICGQLNLPGMLAADASRLFSRNMQTLLQLLAKKGELNIDRADEIVAGSLITWEGEVVQPRIRELMNLGAAKEAAPAAESKADKPAEPARAAEASAKAETKGDDDVDESDPRFYSEPTLVGDELKDADTEDASEAPTEDGSEDSNDEDDEAEKAS